MKATVATMNYNGAFGMLVGGYVYTQRISLRSMCCEDRRSYFALSRDALCNLLLLPVKEKCKFV
jgi:hypothetical protein